MFFYFFSGVCQNRVLRVHENILKQTTFSEGKFSYLLWISCDEILFFYLEEIGGFDKTVFYVSIGTSLGESIYLKKFFFSFSDIARKNFRSFSQFFELVRQNWVPRVHRKIWGEKHTFRLKMYFYIFRILSRIFRLFVESIPPGLSKVHSTIPWNQFEGNNFWEKTILCGHWVKQFPAFCEKKLSSVVKTAF